jgi:hypothetical protein
LAYAGTTVRIASVVKGYNKELLTNADGISVKLNVYDRLFQHVVGPFTMFYDAVHGYWYYDWDTNASSTPAGTYRLKTTVEGGGRDSWKIMRLRLAASPV